MPIRLGTNSPSSIRLGAAEVTRAYLGAAEVYNAAQPWTPSQLANLSAWYDAADASTITLNGSNVAQWDDKSGNGYHISQGSASAQPQYNINRVSFFPNDWLESSSSLNIDQPGAIFGVMQLSGLNGLAFYTGSNDNSSRWMVFKSSANAAYSVFAGLLVTSLPVIQTTNQTIHSVIVDGASSAYFANGELIVSGNPGTNSLGVLYLGKHLTADSTLGHTNFELMFLSGVIAQADQQRVEGYLAWKWGLEANLPLGHPFKNGPPTV